MGKWKTDASVRDLANRWIFDPIGGDTLVQVFEGRQADLVALGRAARRRGGRGELRQREAEVYQLEVQWGDENQDGETSPEVWERVMEWREMDIRSSPQLLAAADNDVAVVAEWYRTIEDALQTGKTLALGAGTPQLRLFQIMARGVRTFPVRSYMLRRRGTIPLRFISQDTVAGYERAYTTAALRREFGVPDEVGTKLPVAGAGVPLDGEMWAWVERGNNATMTPYYGRAEVYQEWIFGLVSTVLFEVVE